MSNSYSKLCSNSAELFAIACHGTHAIMAKTSLATLRGDELLAVIGKDDCEKYERIRGEIAAKVLSQMSRAGAIKTPKESGKYKYDLQWEVRGNSLGEMRCVLTMTLIE